MTAVKAEKFNLGAGLDQQALQFDAGAMGHHGVLFAMGEQHLGVETLQQAGARMPFGMGIAAAAHQASHLNRRSIEANFKARLKALSKGLI